MFCSKCGTNLPDGAAACPSCNNAVEAGTPGGAPNTPPPVPTPPPIAPKSSALSKDNFTKFINFDIMITPMIIKIVYIAGSIMIVLMPFWMMITGGIAGGFLGAIAGLFFGVIIAAVSLVLFRLACEQIKLFFSIHKELKDVKEKMK
ncbi:MAG: DUF4282 domain-containing protein [Defluviitaleaceae bacterium]|nr:DUF4282 domain-containing protein [Defluviitaleaceae bacterium]